MLLRLSLPVVLSVLAVATCGEEPTPPSACPRGFLGHATPAQLEVWALGETGEVLPLEDGASVPLLFAPQGGRVAFIGVKATGVDSCGVQLTAAVRDLQSGQVRLDGRTVNLEPDGTGWGLTSSETISSLANVPLCPNQWSGSNLYDAIYALSVTAQDGSGRSATKTVQVRLACPANDSECRCICKAGYVLGEACGTSGGGSGADGG